MTFLFVVIFHFIDIEGGSTAYKNLKGDKKMYIVTSMVNEELSKPDLFRDEDTAYLFFANTLFNELNNYLEDDDALVQVDAVLENLTASAIKSMMCDWIGYAQSKGVNVSYTSHGFAFGDGYRLEIFEVKEK